jgi:hypothetical protein
MKKERIVSHAAVCALGMAIIVPARAGADEKMRDFYYQQNQQRFVAAPQDARMFGMAGSSILTTANAVSLVNNPAGLGRMKDGDLSASYGYNKISGNEYPRGNSVEDQQNIGQVYGATPLGPRRNDLPEYGNLGLGWFGRNGEWGDDPAQTDADTYQVSGGYGWAIGEKAAMGYSLTYQDDSLKTPGHSYDSAALFRHNLGIQWEESNDLRFGGAMTFGHGKHNLNHDRLVDLREGQTVDQFSYGLGFGAEYDLNDATTVASVIDYTYYQNNGDNSPLANDVVYGGDSTANVMNLRFGIENRPADWAALRLGWRYAANFAWNYDRADLDPVLSGSAKYNAFTGGVGVKYDLPEGNFITAIKLDYGVEYRLVGQNDWQHVVTLSTPFDLCV